MEALNRELLDWFKQQSILLLNFVVYLQSIGRFLLHNILQNLSFMKAIVKPTLKCVEVTLAYLNVSFGLVTTN